MLRSLALTLLLLLVVAAPTRPQGFTCAQDILRVCGGTCPDGAVCVAVGLGCSCVGVASGPTLGPGGIALFSLGLITTGCYFLRKRATS